MKLAVERLSVLGLAPQHRRSMMLFGLFVSFSALHIPGPPTACQGSTQRAKASDSLLLSGQYPSSSCMGAVNRSHAEKV
jgi:hypothetical protein